MWSDPDPDVLGWGPSDRGVSFVFGADVLGSFLSKMDLDLVVRGHQVYSHFNRYIKGALHHFIALDWHLHFDKETNKSLAS